MMDSADDTLTPEGTEPTEDTTAPEGTELTETIPPPPPSNLFDSFDELMDFLQGFYRENGAALVRRSNGPKRKILGKELITHRSLGCDRGGVIQPSVSRGIRNKPSIKLGCPVRIQAKTNQMLEGKWMYVVMCATHNHPPSKDPSEHSAHRRRTPQQVAIATSLVKYKGIKAREMRQILEDSSPKPTFFRAKDIYNFRQQALRTLKSQGNKKRKDPPSGGADS
jgi:hypothetical protein